MILGNPYGGYGSIDTTNHTAKQLSEYARTVARREKMGLKGDPNDGSFASKLKRADEFMASGEYEGPTDSIGIVLQQMDEPTPGNTVNKDFWHNGAHVSISKDSMYGTTITIGGSSNPEWVHVDTSVGTVKIDLNDMTSLMKCLDLFSPEDINAILRKIQEVKQTKEALSQIERMQDELVKNGRDKKKEGGEEGTDQSVGEVVGVVSAEEMRGIEEKREKKFIG